jgi:flagellar biosynthetic protein FliQ
LAEGGNVSPEFVVHLGKEAIFLMLLISAPMLIAGLVVGLGISILQAVTQIHEVTLTFIPKILAVSLALMVALPWMLQKMLDFMQLLMSRIPMMAN